MEKQKNTTRVYKRNDIILIVSVLFVCAVALVYLFVFRKGGNTVKVMVDGKLYATYSLSQNIQEDIYTGKNNQNVNRLVIQDNKAYIEYASCPDGICVAHSRIFRDGESIVCLPHRVIVTVVDEKEQGADIVA